MLNPNVTGGLFWHWQAWRSQAAWKPTVDSLEAWLKLQTKGQTPDTLVIIGASAGWMMPVGWLCQFKEVHTFDIDPLAAPLFRWRHGQELLAPGLHHVATQPLAMPRLEGYQHCGYFLPRKVRVADRP